MRLSKDACLELGKTYIEKHKTYPAAKKWTIATAQCSRDRIYENWGNWADFIAELKLRCSVPNIIKFIPNTGLVEVVEDKTNQVLVSDRKWDKESVINKLLESAKKHGKPKRSDFISNKGYPSLHTISIYLGSWQKAVEYLEIKTPITSTESIEHFLLRELSYYSQYLPTNKTVEDVVNLFISGNRKAGWNTNTAKHFTDKFSGKISRQPYHIWFLSSKQLKWCRPCNKVLPYENFSSSVSSTDKVQSYCKDCTSSYMKNYSDRGSKRRITLLKAKPVWANDYEIALFYKKCPIGYHVDHIVPLQGKDVCGLHVLSNLQYLSAKENIQKSNKFNGGWASWDGFALTSRD